MIEAYKLHNTIQFVQSLGSVLRSILDFDSYTSLSGSLDQNRTPLEDFLSYSKSPSSSSQAIIWEKREDMDRRIEEAALRIENGRKTVDVSGSKGVRMGQGQSPNPFVMLAPGFQWGTRDYVQAPLALVIGALHALPADTNGPACSSNATSLRSYILQGLDYEDTGDEQTDKLEVALRYYTGLAYLDEVGVFCQQSITSTLS